MTAEQLLERGQRKAAAIDAALVGAGSAEALLALLEAQVPRLAPESLAPRELLAAEAREEREERKAATIARNLVAELRLRGLEIRRIGDGAAVPAPDSLEYQSHTEVCRARSWLGLDVARCSCGKGSR